MASSRDLNNPSDLKKDTSLPSLKEIKLQTFFNIERPRSAPPRSENTVSKKANKKLHHPVLKQSPTLSTQIETALQVSPSTQFTSSVSEKSPLFYENKVFIKKIQQSKLEALTREIVALAPLKDINVDKDILFTATYEALVHIIAESKEVLSWIPVGSIGPKAHDLTLNIINYRHSLFNTMREVALKAHNIPLSNAKYYNNRSVHAMNIGNTENTQSVSMHVFDTDNVEIAKHAKSCPWTEVPSRFSASSSAAHDLSELHKDILNLLSTGAKKITIYLDKNYFSGNVDLKRQTWFADNAWLGQFLRDHSNVELYEYLQNEKNKSYVSAKSLQNHSLSELVVSLNLRTRFSSETPSFRYLDEIKKRSQSSLIFANSNVVIPQCPCNPWR